MWPPLQKFPKGENDVFCGVRRRRRRMKGWPEGGKRVYAAIYSG